MVVASEQHVVGGTVGGSAVGGGAIGGSAMISGTKVDATGTVVGGPGMTAAGAESCQADCLESGMGRVCFEPDPYTATADAQWKYVGAGNGAYDSVQQVAYVGQGSGSWDREEVIAHKGYRCRTMCMTMALCVLFIAACILLIPLFFTKHSKGFDVPLEQDCSRGAHDWHHLWDVAKQNYCCQYQSIGCPDAVATPVKIVHQTHYVTRVHRVPHPVTHYVQVPVKHVVYKHVYTREQPYDCTVGFEDYTHKWTIKHQRYCCFAYEKACMKKVVKHIHNITVVKTKLVPKYIPMKETKEKTLVVPKYVPKIVESKPIHVAVHQPPKIVYRTVNKTQYIKVPVPGKPKVIVQDVPYDVNMAPEVVKVYDHISTEPEYHEHHFDCDAAFNNWYFAWSARKKAWCCSMQERGCPGTWHGHATLHLEAHTSVGHATGRIYDCNAGFSNWLHGWSDSKQHWCCEKEHRGCAPHSCDDDDVSSWSGAKHDWCCSNFQKGCAATTLSALKCHAVCTHSGETATCLNRIHWTKQHVFSGRDNACALSYSQVQVECSVCRACSIEEAGCSVNVQTSAAFDCNAALMNFFRAWSPAKKQWCCTAQGKGCEGNQPPHVDPGFGMVWKHVQVNGYWTWVAAHGSGAPVKLPYDCHAGLANFALGWSSGKRAWCCSNQHLGCGAVASGGAGAAGAAGGATSSVHIVHSSSGGFVHHSGGGFVHHSSGGGFVHHSSGGGFVHHSSGGGFVHSSGGGFVHSSGGGMIHEVHGGEFVHHDGGAHIVHVEHHG